MISGLFVSLTYLKLGEYLNKGYIYVSEDIPKIE